MEGMTLIRQARTAGLTLRSEGDQLVIRGAKALDGLARYLIARKQDVMAALAREAAIAAASARPKHAPIQLRPGPPGTCNFCGQKRWWGPSANPDNHWTCGACHPPAVETPDTVWFTNDQDTSNTGGNP